MSKEEIEACSTPVESFVVQPKQQKKLTTAIFTTQVKIVLTDAARVHPYAALKVLLKAWTNQRPLSVVRYGDNMVEVYWDSSLESDRVRVINGLEEAGVLQPSSPLTARDVPRRVRAYQWSYFALLRRAALEGLESAEKMAVLDKVDKHWVGSTVADKKRMWKNRTARDKDDMKVAAVAADFRPGRGEESDDEDDDEDDDEEGELARWAVGALENTVYTEYIDSMPVV